MLLYKSGFTFTCNVMSTIELLGGKCIDFLINIIAVCIRNSFIRKHQFAHSFLVRQSKIVKGVWHKVSAYLHLHRKFPGEFHEL